MSTAPGLFLTECRDGVAIVTATRNLSEFVYEALENEASDVLALLGDGRCHSIVIDLSRTEYCGSTALGLFLKLWKLTRGNQGKMSFCGLSDNEKEVFATMKLDSLWPIRRTLDESLAAVNN